MTPALANKFVTFGSVSKNLRINSKVISIWSSILLRIKNSKLLINNFDMNNKEVKEIMLNRFKKSNLYDSIPKKEVFDDYFLNNVKLFQEFNSKPSFSLVYLKDYNNMINSIYYFLGIHKNKTRKL